MRLDSYSDKVIVVTEKYLNPMLLKISKSYTNLFLFDDNATLYNYIKKIREEISIDTRFDDKAKSVLNKYLDYLVQFYKKNNEKQIRKRKRRTQNFRYSVQRRIVVCQRIVPTNLKVIRHKLPIIRTLSQKIPNGVLRGFMPTKG